MIFINCSEKLELDSKACKIMHLFSSSLNIHVSLAWYPILTLKKKVGNVWRAGRMEVLHHCVNDKLSVLKVLHQNRWWQKKQQGQRRRRSIWSFTLSIRIGWPHCFHFRPSFICPCCTIKLGWSKFFPCWGDSIAYCRFLWDLICCSPLQSSILCPLSLLLLRQCTSVSKSSSPTFENL